MKLLEAIKLTKIYNKRTVVKKVGFEVNAGEIVGLLGKNGAGKTTSFRMVIGMIKPDKGRVFLNGDDITKLPMYKRARKGMGYLPQESSAFQKLTVEENLLAILETMHLTKKEREFIAHEKMEELQLKKLAKSTANTLSGGERRRLEIARALLTSPQLILLDEPFSGIDPIAVYDIQQIIKDLRDKGIGILLTDHNVPVTLAITDRAYILDEGRVAISGTSQQIINDETARRVYLGDKFRIHEEIEQPLPSQKQAQVTPFLEDIKSDISSNGSLEVVDNVFTDEDIEKILDAELEKFSDHNRNES